MYILLALFLVASIGAGIGETSEADELKLKVLELEKKLLELEQTKVNLFYPLVDNGNETITDTISGLMWTKKKQRFELYRGGPSLSSLVKRNIKKHGVAGYYDWRIPTLSEAKALYNSLGLMKSQRDEPRKDRTLLPFLWRSGKGLLTGDSNWRGNAIYFRFEKGTFSGGTEPIAGSCYALLVREP